VPAARAGPDLGIGPGPPEWTGPIETLGWEEFVVVLPPGDPLRDTEGPIALAEMARRDWVLFERDHGLGWIVEAICATAGFVPSAAVRTEQISGAPALAAAGLGPALVPLNIVPGPHRRWTRRLDPPRARELCAFTRDDWPPLARAFLDLIAEPPWPGRPADTIPVEVIRR
jgi:DNA-binding transcriptional LysR family regulator